MGAVLVRPVGVSLCWPFIFFLHLSPGPRSGLCLPDLKFRLPLHGTPDLSVLDSLFDLSLTLFPPDLSGSDLLFMLDPTFRVQTLSSILSLVLFPPNLSGSDLLLITSDLSCLDSLFNFFSTRLSGISLL